MEPGNQLRVVWLFRGGHSNYILPVKKRTGYKLKSQKLEVKSLRVLGLKFKVLTFDYSFQI